MWDPLRPKYPKKYKNKYMARSKYQYMNKNPFIRKGLGRGAFNTCANFGVYLSKGRGYWTLKEF